MNETPPDQEDSFELDAVYRRVAAADVSRPSEATRRAVLEHAARLAEERLTAARAEGQTVERSAGVRPAAHQPFATARRRWRRPAIFGTLAAAALAGLLIMPQLFAPRVPSTASLAPGAPAPRIEAFPGAPAYTQNVAPMADSAADMAAKKAAPELKLQSRSTAPAAAAEGAAEAQLAESRAGTAQSDTAQSNTPQSADALAARPEGASIARRAVTPSATSSAVAPAPATAPAVRSSSDPAVQLRRAAQRGDVEQLEALLGDATLVDARDEKGRTALMVATLHGQRGAVDVLLSRGADPNAADEGGSTPLRAAVSRNEQAIAAALRRAGAR